MLGLLPCWPAARVRRLSDFYCINIGIFWNDHFSGFHLLFTFRMPCDRVLVGVEDAPVLSDIIGGDDFEVVLEHGRPFLREACHFI